MKPEISVLLPFRNAERTLHDALASTLADPSAAIEIIAIDDGSSDGSHAIADAFEDPRVSCVRTDGGGLVAALEHARGLARAPLLARMDADDVTLPGRFGAQRDYLLAHESVAVVGTRVEALGGREGLRLYVRWQNALLTSSDHAREIFIESPLCHPSVMMRASALDAVGGYVAGDHPEDYELWLRLHDAGWELAKLPTVLLQWRHGPGRLTFEDPRYAVERFTETKVRYLPKHLLKRPLVVWGAGKTGRRFMRALEKHGPRVDLWVDIDPAKIGRTARGAPIHPPAVLDPERHMVLVSVGSRGARALIREDLQKRGFVEGGNALFVA